MQFNFDLDPATRSPRLHETKEDCPGPDRADGGGARRGLLHQRDHEPPGNRGRGRWNDHDDQRDHDHELGDRRGGTGGSVTQPPLEPGSFQNPLVLLQRLQGASGDHLHIDEVRYRPDTKHLYQCSYTFGVIDASAPQAMKYLSEGLKHTVPNDTRQPGCIHLAWDGNYVFTTHRGNIDNPAFLTAWDITNPKALCRSPRSRKTA